MQIDFGKTAQDYGRYRAGFPSALFDRLATFDIGTTGQRVLDLGTGTGTLARGFALPCPPYRRPVIMGEWSHPEVVGIFYDGGQT